VAATVEAAVAGGAMMVRVRDNGAGDRALYELTRELKLRLAGTGVPLIVNNSVDVAIAAGADGAHVGQDDLPAPAVRALVGREMLVGLSITAPGQLSDLAHWPPGTVDYLGVGPIFATATKPDAAPPMGLDGLASVVASSPVPCVAIGGIDATSAGAVRAAGAAGVAVVSALCAAGDPSAEARRLRAAMPS
jgi:thiamine-phosphate pyrophosphorylase